MPPTLESTYGEVTNPTLVPEKTDTYVPLPNAKLISLTKEMVGNAGLDVVDAKYKMNKAGTQFFGALALNDADDGISSQVAMVNSYDKSRAAGIALGARVDACWNLSFSHFKRMKRHFGKEETFMEDLNDILAAARERIRKEADIVRQRYSTLKNVKLTGKDAAFLSGTLFFRGLLGASQMMDLRRHLTGETDYVFGRKTWFDFDMHLTEILKQTHPYHLVDHHMEAEEFIIEQAKQRLSAN